MSSNGNGNGLNGTHAILLRDQPGDRMTVFDDAVQAMARAQEEIDQLWRNAVTVDDEPLSERLVEVSHALQRAARLLDDDRAIG